MSAAPDPAASVRPGRRRFLVGAAALGLCAALPGARAPLPVTPSPGDSMPVARWTGRALGAEASIAVRGEPAEARPALLAAIDALRRTERLFSLYDPSSALSRLNREGRLAMPPEFARLIGEVDRAHALTAGAFDPTVQPLFAAMLRAGGRLDPAERRALDRRIGWRRVALEGRTIRLAPGMALTLNGIAQGFATDRVVETLLAHGFPDVVVDAGELRVGTGPARVGLPGPDGAMRAVALERAALATSERDGFLFADGTGHLLDPRGPMTARATAAWRRVSVRATTATLADALSTGLSLVPDAAAARHLVGSGAAGMVWLDGRPVSG